MDKVQLKVGKYVVQRVWNMSHSANICCLLVSGSMPDDGHTGMSERHSSYSHGIIISDKHCG